MLKQKRFEKSKRCFGNLILDSMTELPAKLDSGCFLGLSAFSAVKGLLLSVIRCGVVF